MKEKNKNFGRKKIELFLKKMNKNFREIENIGFCSVTVIRPFEPNKEFDQLINSLNFEEVRKEARKKIKIFFFLLKNNFLKKFKFCYENELSEIESSEDITQVYERNLDIFSDFCQKINFEFLEDEVDEMKLEVLHYLIDTKNQILFRLSDENDEENFGLRKVLT